MQVVYLVTLGSISKVAGLEHELRGMASQTKAFEETLEKASEFVVKLSEYVSALGGPGTAAPGGGIPPAEYFIFKASQEQAIDSICQELKGGGVTLGR
jgi:hypothetical protein